LLRDNSIAMLLRLGRRHYHSFIGHGDAPFGVVHACCYEKVAGFVACLSHFAISVLGGGFHQFDFFRREAEQGVDTGVEVGFALDNGVGVFVMGGALLAQPCFPLAAVFDGDVGFGDFDQFAVSFWLRRVAGVPRSDWSR